MLAYSDFEMAFSLAIIGGVAATTLKFVNNARGKVLANAVFITKKIRQSSLSLEH